MCLCVGVFLLRSGGEAGRTAVRAEMLPSLCPSVYL